MFVISLKTDRKQALTAIGCAAVLLIAVLTAVMVPKPEVTATSARVTNSEDRLAYLRACGIEADGNSEEVREVRLPDEPDETVAEYNALQEQSERSLAPYYGKRLRLYTYDAVTNDGAATAHLYVYRDRVVAGDVTIGDTIRVI